MAEGKSVLVTGAARGLGKSLVDSLVDRGWEVWATDVSPIDPTETRAHHVDVLDVTNKQEVERVVASNPKGFDGLVNNAGIFPLVPWDELDLDTFNRTLQVNVIGTFLACQAMGKAMRDRGRGGSIVNISSVTFFQGQPSACHYTASKGGVVGLTRSLAKALGQYRIRVNCIAPGMMLTEGIVEQVRLGTLDASRVEGAQDPLRCLPGRTEPDRLAHVASFLLSDDAFEVTGQQLAVSGGTYFV